MQNCLDAYQTTFETFEQMHSHHQNLEKNSQWLRCKDNSLHIAALDKTSALYGDRTAFAEGVSNEAVEDTADHLGLAIKVEGEWYPLRETAYKSLLDRAKISGTSLLKLSRSDLASVLNACLKLFPSHALVLVRDEKVSAVHSGDSVDYSVLPVDQLMDTLQTKLDTRFPGNVFEQGYANHAFSCASWRMPNQKSELLDTYAKALIASGKNIMASKLTPGIRFLTSDTGLASAKVSALLMGGEYPIYIGSCVAVDHRHQSKVSDFEEALDQLFAQYGETLAQLQKLMEVTLMYPVNAMTRICKKLSMPKKVAVEAIAMYEMAYGGGPATAHDVFLAMQEIPFIMRSCNTSESKLLALEENLARALTLKWSEYDLPKAVSY